MRPVVMCQHQWYCYSEVTPVALVGVTPKAFLLLNPPWSTNFKNNRVTLTCRDSLSPAQGDISWYHNDHLLDNKYEEIQIHETGYYKCKTRRSSPSDPVHMDFLSERLIIQAPHPVFEGDDVVLRCQGREATSETVFYKNGKKISKSYTSNFTLNSVSRDNGKYHCTASRKAFWGNTRKEISKPLTIQVQELFPPPVLTARPSQPIEGRPVTLKCETWLPPQRSYIQLQFCFFREDQALGSGWSSSPELYLPTMWSEDSSSYWCQAETVTHRVRKRSLRSQIHVQRVPVSAVNLEIQPPEGQLIEGENLLLICSVAKGTGTVTFSWHREGTVRSLGTKTQRSLSAELQILTVKERDAGRYYCAADNIHGPILSELIRVTLRIPVSRPVLTLRAPGAQAVVGDMMELHCEAQRGSPPILYRFYHEDVSLGSSSASSGGGVSFNLSLTAEHFGNYSCEADNGLGVQLSDRVTLNVTVPVSHPVFTFHPAGAQAMVGDVLELRCEAQRGSPPILYWFYHKNVTLGSISGPFGGGASFNLTLMAEHSGNYFCGADNGLGVQRSEMATLSVTDGSLHLGPSSNKTTLITEGVTAGLLSILGLAAAAALVCYFRIQRNSGGLSTTGTPSYSPREFQEPSRTSNTDPQEPTYSEPPDPMELQPVHSNVDLGESNLVYSQIWSIQDTKENSANSPKKHWEDKEPAVIYSELKKAHLDDSAGLAINQDRDPEDAAENYENVPCALSAVDH
ncbi:LOW QUALITY PROTEIN: Fc receptor-like protein 3 [Mesoplodon densirostris]|uniref:LOW QUALITY PROTEIN: Fc receptor-like protein 3 n=1 Tax=Mesoplodon densirostris TaxID=48708 RepID=UPI0028DC610E|nr:LOW QUALITY PROTEIN: Fc receptor-like protein 3 [Mesoplodon densirostris]